LLPVCLSSFYPCSFLPGITTSAQKADGLFINLTGRQRMLSQKMSKEIVLYASITDAKQKETLLATAKKEILQHL
jgi:methyl-accepting chemotaxis protein